MTNRFGETGAGRLATARGSARIGRVLLVALALAVAIPAAAEEPQQFAQAGEPEPGTADPDSAPEPEGAAEPKPAARPTPPPTSGIEEIVVRGAESEAARDFEAADSVTGFGAEDLAALGAQDIADLAAFTPNLEIVTSGATTPTFFIRGVGLNDFNANSTGAVAIYRDDVAINAPAIQLSSLFDVETVTILRGPQGTGLARNASAGAIKVYSRKPTGEFGGFLRSDLGNFDFRDFEGAIEAPFFEDILAGRFAFRFSERDGTMKNRCGNAPAFADRVQVPTAPQMSAMGKTSVDPPWSICGEPVLRVGPAPWVSTVPEGLPSRVNDIGNWAARGTLLFQPTLDMSWLLNAHGARRDEWTRLGQTYGTQGFYEEADGTRIQGVLGGSQGVGIGGYQTIEVRKRLAELAPCYEMGIPGAPPGLRCIFAAFREAANAARITVAEELAERLDSEPWEGDFNMCSPRWDPITGEYEHRDPTGTRCKKDKGRTTNDNWGAFLKGEVVLPLSMQLNTVTGFETYERLIDIDLDFSPETLFQIRTEDQGWQASQDLRLQGELGEESQVRWDVGGWFLREHLDVRVANDLGNVSLFGVGSRDYIQDIYSAAGYVSLAFDLGDDFTLDGGFRYNWENKKLDYHLVTGIGSEQFVVLDEVWQAPTGTIRLTYRFREDTQVFWKYTRGWKPGTYNATSSPAQGVSIANPEEIDAFEAGLSGSWFDGRLGLDLSVFYYSYAEYQLFIAQQFAGGQPEFVILNASDAEVYGAEIDAVARPWTGAFLNVRFGWLDSQFLDFVQLQQEIISVQGVQKIVNRELQNTGNDLLNSPRFKVSITAEQEVPLGRWGSLIGRYDGVWTDTTYFDATMGRGIPNVDNVPFLPEETIAQPAFWTHNLKLSYRLPGGRVEIAGWVRNLTNVANKTFAFDGSTFNKTTIYFVGDPRTYGGSLVVNF